MIPNNFKDSSLKFISKIDNAISTNAITDSKAETAEEQFYQIAKSVVKDPTTDEKQLLLEMHLLVMIVNGQISGAEAMLSSAADLYLTPEAMYSSTLRAFVSERLQDQQEQDSTVRKESKTNGLVGAFLYIAGIAVLFGLLNLVFVGGQKLFHHGDQVKLDSLKQQIATDKANLEAESSAISTEEDQLSTMQTQLDNFEKNNDTTSYNNMVGNYNDMLGRYKSDLSTYNESLPRYNKKIDEANKLAKSVGSTYYVVPIATGRH